MKRIDLVKYGFVRSPEDDFSDDGARFTCYRVGNIRVSKTIYQGEAFISAQPTRYNLNYDLYSKLPHYNDLDKLNGVYIDSLVEQDLIDLYNACVAYEKEYEDAENNVVYPTIDEIKEQCLKIRAHYKEQQEEAMDLITKAANNLILNASEYELRSLRNYLGTITTRANAYDPETYPQSLYRSAYSFDFIKPTNSDLTYTWYLEQIKDIVKKYC